MWLKDRDPNGRIVSGIPQTRQFTYGVGVLWVAVDPSFRADTREHNVALIVTMWPLQFNSFTYPICLPSPEDSDTNAEPLGILKYSVKALRKSAKPLKKFTGTTGLSIYGQCVEKTCIK